MNVVANLLALLVMPIVLVGTINRVKARWAGRRGSPIFQLAFDLYRLARKGSVYSTVTTPVFRIAPLVVAGTAIISASIVPLAGGTSIVSFPFDFVWFAYVWSLGRAALVLGALDTGSSFEGMGASREATFATLLEPVLFLVAGALCLHAGVRSLGLALVPQLDGPPAVVMWIASVVAILVVVQVEAARMPIDDPTTHLELTMVHEVMILDHSGPDLALLQLGAAIKLFVGISLAAMLLNPMAGDGVLGALVHVGLCIAIAIAIGLSESLMARLKLRVVPQYIVVGLVAGGIALLSMLGRGGPGMNPLLIAFIGILLVPLFVASWRLSVFALAAQGLLMASLSYQLDPTMSSASSWVGMFDLVIVRGIGAPLALYAVLRAQRATPRNDVIPPNLMSWTLAIGLVLVAFRFADMLVPIEGDEHSFVAGATAGVLLGLLVLATQTGPFSQMVGVLRLENAIALFELGSHGHELSIQIAQTVLLIVTVLMFQWYLRTLPRTSATKVSAVEGLIT